MSTEPSPLGKAMYVASAADRQWLQSEQRKLYLWSWTEPGYTFRKLWGLATDPRNLRCALVRVARNRGRRTAGVDGKTVCRILASGSDRFLEDLRAALRNRAFRPSPVRRVMIPKPGKPGEYRPLGIPTVADRVVTFGGCARPACRQHLRRARCVTNDARRVRKRGPWRPRDENLAWRQGPHSYTSASSWAAELKANSGDEASTLPDLFDQMETPIQRLTADGTYDHKSVYDRVSAAGAKDVVIVIPLVALRCLRGHGRRVGAARSGSSADS
jgi:hypothetical protein